MNGYYVYEDTIIGPAELGELLQIGKNQTYTLLNSGKISAWRIGRSWKIPRTAVDEYIKNECRARAIRIIV